MAFLTVKHLYWRPGQIPALGRRHKLPRDNFPEERTNHRHLLHCPPRSRRWPLPRHERDVQPGGHCGRRQARSRTVVQPLTGLPLVGPRKDRGSGESSCLPAPIPAHGIDLDDSFLPTWRGTVHIIVAHDFITVASCGILPYGRPSVCLGRHPPPVRGNRRLAASRRLGAKELSSLQHLRGSDG